MTGNAAPSSNDSFLGSGNAMSAATVTSSAWPLKRVPAITRSPTLCESTPSPTDSISPATS